MARLIVKQPNGLYAMWSTIIDDFVLTDLTEEEYIQHRCQDAFENKREELQEVFQLIKEKNTMVTMATMDYNRCLEILKEKENEDTED